MTLFYRRLTYIAFIVIFLVAAPAIILYTSGYRYNFQKSRVQKTGILIVSSIPRRAQVYLNNQLLEGKTTPQRLENMLAGDYEIKLTKDGYHDWQKKLTIFENSSTFAEKVILWKNSRPTQILDQEVSDWLASPDHKQAAVIINGQLSIFNFNDGQLLNLANLSRYTSISLLGWSNTSKKILLKAESNEASNYLIYSVEQKIDSRPFTVSAKKYQLVKWDLENDNLLYGINQSGAWSIDLFSSQEKQLYADQNLQDFLLLDGQYYIFKNQELIKIDTQSQAGETLEQINCQDCHFANRYFPKIILSDPDNQKTFIADPDRVDPLIKLDTGQINWLKDDSLVLNSPWEIWIYENKKTEPELITRVGQPLQQVLWHPLGRHLLFVESNKIKIIELDNRELRNVIDLASLDNFKYLAIDSSGNNLYFSGGVNGQAGIFKLNVK